MDVTVYAINAKGNSSTGNRRKMVIAYKPPRRRPRIWSAQDRLAPTAPIVHLDIR